MSSQSGIRPYIVKTYDRWIILAIVLIGGWFLFRPLFAFSVFYRGLTFEHTVMLKTAEHYYRKAISVDPNIPEGWAGVGELAMVYGRNDPAQYAKAVDVFTKGLEHNPRSGVLAFDLCRTYYEIGRDYRDARDACELATRNNPASGFTWDYAGWSNLRLGDVRDALAYWREAVKHGHAPAAEFIKRYSHRG